MGSIGMLKVGSVPRHQFNLQAFSQDLKSKTYGISKVKRISDQSEDWYDVKL